jgi:hypothetical protein
MLTRLCQTIAHRPRKISEALTEHHQRAQPEAIWCD